MTERSRARVVATGTTGLLTAVLLVGCVPAAPRETAVDVAGPARPASADACVARPRPTRLHGLPLVDSDTQRVAPHVVGEKLTWRAGSEQIVAWVGIDAIDVYEDLDFVPVGRRPVGERVWRTKAVPDLVVAEAGGGPSDPCGEVYVSTNGLGAQVAHGVAHDLRVRHVPAD